MRLDKIDIFRGIAIVLMVIFHLNYTLVNIFNIQILNFSTIFWFIIGKISVILFMFIAGMSFYLAEKKYSKNIIKKYLKISIVLAIFAGIISLITYIFYREFYIRFGILHYFSLSFLLMLFFRKFRYYNIIIGITVIVYGIYFIPVIQSKYFYFLGFMYPGFKSGDYYPIFPYFGIMLLGYTLSLHLSNINKLDILRIKNNKNIIEKQLEFLGKKSFLIYLIHEPVIICFIYIYKLF